MRAIKTTFIFILTLIILAGCSSNPRPEEFSRIDALQNTQTTSGISNIRQQALQESGGSLGAQAGLAWRSKQINKLLKNQNRELDRVFNFDAMLLDHNVLPPVLVEGRNILNLDNNETIRLADHEYQIIFPPRFVTAAPTWHDYLSMSYKKPETPSLALLPKNAAERAIWNKYLRLGWNNGVDQANQIFQVNLNRLHRDFEGMILYRKLYTQHMVSKPFVSQADLGVTGGGTEMRINDRILRITSTSELLPNSKNWHPVITTPKPAPEPVAKIDGSQLRNLMDKLPQDND